MEQNLARRLLETEVAGSPSEVNRTGDSSYVGEMNFDANMVLILAALSCALIGALGMNSIVRYVLRCSQSPEAAAATGLKKRDLGLIPVGVYGLGGAANIKGTDCAICLGDFEDGDKVRMLPVCNHGFHVRCIDTWLLSHSSCPTCRHSLLKLKVKANAAVSQPPPPPPPGSASTHVLVLLQSRNQTMPPTTQPS